MDKTERGKVKDCEVSGGQRAGSDNEMVFTFTGHGDGGWMGGKYAPKMTIWRMFPRMTLGIKKAAETWR